MFSSSLVFVRLTVPTSCAPLVLLCRFGLHCIALSYQVEAQRRAKKAAQAAADCALRDLSTATKRVSAFDKEKSRYNTAHVMRCKYGAPPGEESP